MHQPDPYPRSVEEVLDQSITFNPLALRAVQSFARSRPWRGTIDERQLKFRKLHNDLCLAYRLDPQPRLIIGNEPLSCSGNSGFIPAMNTIILRGRLSVVTYLHEVGHARGMNERRAARWSINLFRRCFPKSWSRVTIDGHNLLIRKSPLHLRPFWPESLLLKPGTFLGGRTGGSGVAADPQVTGASR